MARHTVATQPIADQKAGTSGLRRKTRDFMAPHFLENYVQAVINAIGGAAEKRFVVGGDGRYFNDRAIQVILRMAAANGARGVIVGQNGILSTPAASHLIRKHGMDGGFLLTASHNPGGVDQDFGLKFNMANGGPATESVSDAIFAQTQALSAYRIFDAQDVDLAVIGQTRLGAMTVTVVDPVVDYAALMATLFDFDALRGLFAGGFRMAFDAMHAVTGPYAKHLLEERLGAPRGTVINGTPLPDFGGGHPDPNPIWAQGLMAIMAGPDAPNFGAASDGDGDRNMIIGRGAYVTPSDSLAVLAAHHPHLKGVARSMPTSAAVDRVARAKGVACYEVPTGWKFFGTLLDAGLINLCGEESAGTGADHVREKDGLWAVLSWLSVIASTGQSVAALMAEHWQKYGRNYYARHDYEAIDTDKADAVMQALRGSLPALTGQSFAGLVVTRADEFAYDDPIDGSHTAHQGIRVIFGDTARVVFRLSGTGTAGATLRVYLERLETDPGQLDQPTAAALAAVTKAAAAIAEIARHTGRQAPDVIT